MGISRLRRLRASKAIRDLASETKLDKQSLVLPYFIVDGKGIKREIKSMPGIYHFSPDMLAADVADAYMKGIRTILLFGVSDKKESHAEPAYAPDNAVERAIRILRKEFSPNDNSENLTIMTDVCVCGYTPHGHCGIVDENGRVDNDKTLPLLINMAENHAEAGADFVAPSAMMDGQVGAIRDALDGSGYAHTGIMAYSAKYASHFYSPFRDAVQSAPQFGDRTTYQMDFRNADEAVREAAIDIKEGADIDMVKPSLAYLDVIYRIKQAHHVPLAAYNVSGEYVLLKQKESRLERNLVLEVMTAIKRAGADIIITYFARDLCRWL